MTRTRPVANATQVDYDTARVPRLSAADQAHKDAQRATARKNLAAIVCGWYDVRPGQRNVPAAEQLAAREFADLAEALGLDPVPERAPGTCRSCGGPMHLNRQIRRDSRVNGLCETCDKDNTIACRRNST